MKRSLRRIHPMPESREISFAERFMRKLFVVLSLTMVLASSGCNKAEVKRVSRETAGMATKFNELVKAGKTTREQEQAYINAVAMVTYEMDRAIRGTEEADRTKRNSTIEATTGVNPEGPLKLDQ